MNNVRASMLFLIAAAALPAFGQGATAVVSMSEPTRPDVKQAVESHRIAKRDETQRAESIMGRRLTPAELAELRQQIREQWVPRQPELIRSADSGKAPRIVPVPVPMTAATGTRQ